jgi:hypothetical protein
MWLIFRDSLERMISLNQRIIKKTHQVGDTTNNKRNNKHND